MAQIFRTDLENNRLRGRRSSFRPWWKIILSAVWRKRLMGPSGDFVSWIHIEQTRGEVYWKWFTRLGGQALLWLYVSDCIIAGRVVSFANFRAFLAHIFKIQGGL